MARIWRSKHLQFGGGSIVVGGWFSSSGTSRVQIIEGKINGDILEKNLLPGKWEWDEGGPFHNTQQSKTYHKGDSHLVPKIENKGVGMILSISRLKPNKTSVQGSEDKADPLQSLRLKEWSKIIPEFWEISFFVQKVSLSIMLVYWVSTNVWS